MMWKSVQQLNIQYQPRISLQIRVALSSLLIFLDHGNDLLLLQSCPISSRISEPRSFPPRLSFKLPLTEKPSNEKRELLLASRPAHETKLQDSSDKKMHKYKDDGDGDDHDDAEEDIKVKKKKEKQLNAKESVMVIMGRLYAKAALQWIERALNREGWDLKHPGDASTVFLLPLHLYIPNLSEWQTETDRDRRPGITELLGYKAVSQFLRRLKYTHASPLYFFTSTKKWCYQGVSVCMIHFMKSVFLAADSTVWKATEEGGSANAA